jgi:hypothetical protein
VREILFKRTQSAGALHQAGVFSPGGYEGLIGWRQDHFLSGRVKGIGVVGEQGMAFFQACSELAQNLQPEFNALLVDVFLLAHTICLWTRV